MGDEHFSRNFFIAALFSLVILSALIVFPFATAVMFAAILSYLTYPLYKKIAGGIGRQFAAGLIVLLLIVLLTIPSYFMLNALTKEGYTLYITAKQKLAVGFDEKDCVAEPGFMCNTINNLIGFTKGQQFKFYVEDAVSKLTSYIVNKASNFFVNLPKLFIDLVVMFFMIYYFLLDGLSLIKKIKTSIPLKTHHIDEVISQFNNFTHATIYGNLITALVQGTIGGLIFWILGIQAPIIAGIAMAFFAFLPVVGTPIVWLPAAISLFIGGETSKAVILLILGTFVISTIDNIIKPEIIGKRTRLHPAAVLIGIFGGMFTMGLIGILIGPLVLSLLISFVEVYYKEGY
ncbi:AI-2E family transporter [Candidatus Woesearchaeota archaeon]|nr:AI-2E family transporter [Candidatus Woesearchaeota archaeon]